MKYLHIQELSRLISNKCIMKGQQTCYIVFNFRSLMIKRVIHVSSYDAFALYYMYIQKLIKLTNLMGKNKF